MRNQRLLIKQDQREKPDNFMDFSYKLPNKWDSSSLLFKDIGKREKAFNIYWASAVYQDTVLSKLPSHLILTQPLGVAPLSYFSDGGQEGAKGCRCGPQFHWKCKAGLVVVVVMAKLDPDK